MRRTVRDGGSVRPDPFRADCVVVALVERRGRTPLRALLEWCLPRGVVIEDGAEFYERLTGKLPVESSAHQAWAGFPWVINDRMLAAAIQYGQFGRASCEQRAVRAVDFNG